MKTAYQILGMGIFTPAQCQEADAIDAELSRLRKLVDKDTFREKVEFAIGGAYEMPDGRAFWIDRPISCEMARRVTKSLLGEQMLARKSAPERDELLRINGQLIKERDALAQMLERVREWAETVTDWSPDVGFNWSSGYLSAQEGVLAILDSKEG